MSIEKLLVNILYAVGAAITAVLSVIILLRIDVVLNPDAMLPMQLWESATVWLAVGFFPMLIACIGAYEVNDIRLKSHAKRNTLLIFLPGILCFCCFAVIVGLLIWGAAWSNMSI